MTDSIYTVQTSQSFLDAVARGVLDQNKDDPLAMADTTILVPDADTSFALRQAFVDQMQGRPAIMPNIEVPDAIDPAQLALQVTGNAALEKKLAALPLPISRLRRQLILASEILKITGMASSPQKATKLGDALGRLLDDAQRYNVSFANIDKLVSAEFKKDWAQTADFLKIITQVWPKKLAELGASDPEAYRSALLNIRTEYWRSSKHATPVLAVGFTESAPAMGTLLKTVAELPQGKVIVQGLDTGLEQKSWDAIAPVHPQYELKNMLAAIGVDRSVVQDWKAEPLTSKFARAPNLKRTIAGREKLLRETMLPAETPRKPSTPPPTTSAISAEPPAANDDSRLDVHALNGMDLITATTQQEEASVIALKMREALEVPGRKVSFVTEDRDLARRVSARLQNWKITVNDEAGVKLPETPVGVYLLTTAAMAAEKWAPVPTLEALRHPLAALGESNADFRRQVSDLEDLVFHGPRPAPGAEGVKKALTAAFNAAAKDPRGKTPEQLAASQAELTALVDKLDAAGKDFFTLMATDKAIPFAEMLDAHIRFVEALAVSDADKGPRRVWRGDDGVKAAYYLKSLRDAATLAPAVTGSDYADMLQGLLRDVMVVSRRSSHPELRIMSPAQARLLKSDIIILGGLNDKVWPPAPAENPWLSPDMAKKLGLPAPEGVIGRAAYDFTQLVSNPNVVLTRSLREGGAPSVASPFLARLMQALQSAGLEKNLENKTRLRDIHVAMHAPASVTPVEAPKPTPPVKARPHKLSVTGIETLMRDPYSIYAKRILKLQEKPPLDAAPSVADRGTFIHAALDTFMKKYPDDMPSDGVEQLLAIGQDSFKSVIDNPTVRAFWWPRFEQIAKWFVGFETERRDMSRNLGTEVHGKLQFDTGNGGTFTLTAIADRIDRDADDKITLIDYKTGAVPDQKDVRTGVSPQLTLEALIAFTGGFEGVDAADVGKLQYWKLSGNRKAAEIKNVSGDIKTLVSEARAGLEKLVQAFNDQATPYLVTPNPEEAPRYNNTRHLSRVDEWSTVKKTGGKQATTSKRRPK